MRHLRLIVTLAAAMAMTGCATTSFERTTSLRSGTEIAGSSIVVYSFLDVRGELFGEKMLTALNAHLVEQFRQRGVTARVVVYEHTGADMDPAAVVLGVNRSVVTIPLKEYLATQRPDEEKHGDKFRLLILPSVVTTAGAGIDSEIVWALNDVNGGKPVWTTKQKTSRTVWWNRDEAPESRAKQFVDGIVGEMTKSGLFGAAAQEQQRQQDEAKRGKKAS